MYAKMSSQTNIISKQVPILDIHLVVYLDGVSILVSGERCVVVGAVLVLACPGGFCKSSSVDCEQCCFS